MICRSTSVGVLILTNCLDWRHRVCGAQIPAPGLRRAPHLVLGGIVALRLNRAYSGVRFTKAEAVGMLSDGLGESYPGS